MRRLQMLLILLLSGSAYSGPHHHQVSSFSWNVLFQEKPVFLYFCIFVGTGYLLQSAN
jgi:hypothetical protein